jgi:hypothetical protein
VGELGWASLGVEGEQGETSPRERKLVSVEGDDGKRTPERLRKLKTKELAQMVVWATKGKRPEGSVDTDSKSRKDAGLLEGE